MEARRRLLRSCEMNHVRNFTLETKYFVANAEAGKSRAGEFDHV
jgi:hypothetical protein